MSLSEVLQVPAQIHRDERGLFRELLSSRFALPDFVSNSVQTNLSVSNKDVFRGFHLQIPPFAQDKLIQCVQGAIRDFVLDPRPDSEDFGKFIEIDLRASDGKAIWIPGHFAHGFLATENDTIVIYSVTAAWSRNHERSIRPDSTALSGLLDFNELTMSDKDRNAPSLQVVASEIASLGKTNK